MTLKIVRQNEISQSSVVAVHCLPGAVDQLILLDNIDDSNSDHNSLDEEVYRVFI